MATYPLATLACTIDASGISAPAYDDVLQSLKASFRLIYGDDAYLEPDSQDGQLLAVFAKAIHDCNMQAIATYNAFSPQTAVGNGLSSIVKINHMARMAASRSTVNVTLTGVAGTQILAGQVRDASGNLWDLPSTVTIPPAGTIVVTATAQVPGALQAPIGSVTSIATPVAGWQSVTNASAASPGDPVESDAALRARQEQAPSLNAVTVLGGLLAALQALPGVSFCVIYENDTNATDSNGLPAHSIAVVIEGGDAQSIADTIYAKKAPGVSTYGTTTVNVVDASGATRAINFFVPADVPIKVAISLQAFTGYNTAIATAIQQSVADYINALTVGEDLVVNRLYVPALLNGSADAEQYKITVLQAGLVSGSVGTNDVPVAFSARASCQVANVTITVV